MNNEFDLVVIGGGSAGLFAVSVANTLGARTCLVEKSKLGGDCTWFGCVPSKTLLKSAAVAQLLKQHSPYGLELKDNPGWDASRVMAHVRDMRNRVYSHETPETFEKKGIKVIIGTPKFLDRETIQVADQKIGAKRFIICTGGHARVPPVQGLREVNYLTNETIFEIEKLPSSLLTLGGGPIGVELSQALNRLGVKVSLVQRGNRILPKEERELSQVVQDRLEKEGIRILTNREAVSIAQKDKGIQITLKDKKGDSEEISGDVVLVAAGRVPNIENLSLEKAGIEYNEKGIKVNPFLQTSNKNIFACGDVVGPYLFTHVAAYMASLCVRNALFKRIAWQKVNYNNITWCTFTEPELAHLGLTEKQAREGQKKVKTYTTGYRECDRAVTDLEKEGLIKVITDNKGYILGAHIAGARAGELIQGFLLAKSLRLPLWKISQVLYIYPTLSELVKKTAAKPLVEKMDNPLVRLLLKAMRSVR